MTQADITVEGKKIRLFIYEFVLRVVRGELTHSAIDVPPPNGWLIPLLSAR